MAKLPITFACGLYDRMLALYTREVEPDGIDLKFLANDQARDIFDRMLLKREFDASEMSSSEYIRHVAAGNCPFVAIPVFPSRVFRHGHIAVDRKVIKSPKDLAGKRIGSPIYSMTAAVFIRGLLQEDHGVDLSGVTWVEGGMNTARPHGAPSTLKVADWVRIEAGNGQSLSERLAAGDIQATIGADLPDAVKTAPHIERLFPNYREVEKDYYRRTTIFPIMHTVVIKREIHEKHPQVAQSLYAAMRKAKDMALGKMRQLGTLRYMLPWLPADLDEIDDVFGGDPWPYGIEPNRQTLEALTRYMVEQGLTAKRVPLDQIFVPVT
jgi:4,5-dihydroxyphthalate decarboxylase